MSMKRNNILNFDKFMSEKTKEVIIVHAYGKDYTVKKEIPAIVPIMLARAADDNTKVSQQEVGLTMLRAGDIMFGKEAINEMCSKGATADDLAKLFRMVFEMVSGQTIDGDDADEASYTDADSKVEVESKEKK